MKVDFRNIALKLNFERIDPNYQSMGTYFFRNDLQRFKLTTSFQAINNKLSVSIPLGYEYNNILGNRSSTSHRFIGSFSGRYHYNQDLAFTFNFANFNAQLFKEILPEIDTMAVNQANSNLTIKGTYLIRHKGEENLITGSIGMQSGRNISIFTPSRSLTKYHLFGSYNFNLKKLDVAMTPSLGFYLYNYSGFPMYRIIPSVTGKRTFLKKKLNISYNLGFILSNGLFGIRNQLQSGYSITPKMGLSMQLFFLQNLMVFRSFSELQAELRWYWRF